MQKTFTFKAGKLLRIVPIFLMMIASFAGTVSAQCTWTTSTVYPQPGLDIPVATVGTNMYAFAGVVNGAIVATSNKFDGASWTAIAPVPLAVEYPSATSDGTNIYIVGGAEPTLGAAQTTTYRYNVGSNTYTTMAPCPTATWNHAAVFLGGKIYKFGGTGAAAVANLNIYDIATNTWTSGAAMPQATSFISAVAGTDGFIYLAGGNVANVGTAKTYRYDPVANTYNDAAIADLPATRWGAASAFYRGGFVMAGGYAGGDATANISTSVLSWDPLANVWNTIAAMPGGRSRMTAAIFNDGIQVLGGRSVASSAFVGENSNYRLFCAPLVACVGTPNPGNTFATAESVCSGTSVTFSAQNATAGTGVTYQWEVATAVGGPYTNAPGVSTNPTYTTTITAAGFYRVRVTCTTNTGTSTPVAITSSACTCLTPDAPIICEGTIQQLSLTGGVNPTLSSGPINVNVPDATPSGAITSLTATVPAGVTISAMTVSINMTHTWDADMTINLVAPNGQILNLVSGQGGSGDNFIGTIFTSGAGTAITAGAPPYGGTFTPQAAIGVGPTGFVSTAANFAALYGTPNGQWRLAMVDGAGGDLGILQDWTLNFTYVGAPTATWTSSGPAGTIFTNSTATTPYVAGSPASIVWVTPATTTTYTANITGGPCAGPNTVVVTVKPRPVVTLNAASGCSPFTITASGAATYVWTPGTPLLNTATGPTVIATVGTTTVFTVVGTGNNGCASLPVSATANAASSAAVLTAVAGATFQIDEGFNAGVPAGWSQQNLSNPIGAGTWSAGAAGNGLDPAFDGAAGSFLWAGYLSGSGTSNLSNWLFSPVINIKNGDIVSFYTRTFAASTFPDNLQLRISTNGTSVNVGATATSVGDFSTLLVDVNPALTAAGYPATYTKYTATIAGVTGTVTGRIAFRYVVPNGGPLGANSNGVGIDRVQYQTPSSVVCANTVSNIAVAITGGVSPYTVVYNNGTSNITVPNYVSGTPINVSSAATTTYTLVSVTSANGCAGTGNSGSATINITPAATITTQPAAITNVCVGGNGSVTVITTPNASLGTTYQWQISTDNGATFTNIVNNATYGGASTATLTITGATAVMNGTQYRVLVTGACGGNLTSTVSVLSVNTPAVITAPIAPSSFSACAGVNNTTLSVTATGNALTYQWQVSTDGGTTFTNITNNANYSGATTATLTITNPPVTFTGNQYRVLVSSGGCSSVTSVVRTLTTVNPAPVVVISASPGTTIAPSQPNFVTLTAAVSSATAPITYQWYKNTVAIPGANAATYVVGPDGAGFYSVSVTDANGCATATSSPISITLTAKPSTTLFIYPSPNSGSFQVRYYNANATATATEYAWVNVYDGKGSRVYTQRYALNGAYTAMNVVMNAHGRGIYRVDLVNNNGERLQTGSVFIF